MSKHAKEKEGLVRSGAHGEHPYGDTGQMIFLLVFLVVWVLDSFVFKGTTFFSASLPLWGRGLIALALLGCAVYLVRSGHRAVSHEVQAEPRVLRDGAFAHVRHPLYLASLLFYLFLMAFSVTILSLVVFAGAFLFYNFIAAYEEKSMEERFGREYTDYKAEVGRWLPKL